MKGQFYQFCRKNVPNLANQKPNIGDKFVGIWRNGDNNLTEMWMKFCVYDPVRTGPKSAPNWEFPCEVWNVKIFPECSNFYHSSWSQKSHSFGLIRKNFMFTIKNLDNFYLDNGHSGSVKSHFRMSCGNVKVNCQFTSIKLWWKLIVLRLNLIKFVMVSEVK